MVSDAAWLTGGSLAKSAIMHKSRRLYTEIGHPTCVAAGPQVAIKVLEHALILQDDISRETLLSTSIAHPGVVRVVVSASCRPALGLCSCLAEQKSAGSQSMLHWRKCTVLRTCRSSPTASRRSA